MTYQYAISAVDDDGFAMLKSMLKSATPQEFTFTHNLLVVDETLDGTGSAISPADLMIDDFYHGAFAGDIYHEWDINAQGPPELAHLGQDRLVLYHDDDFTNQLIGEALDLWGGYLMGGGKMEISGWKTAGELESAFLQRFTPGIGILYDNRATMICAVSDQMPDLYPDPAKLAAAWNGRLPMVHTFTGEDTPLYQAVMIPESNGDGQCASFRMDCANDGALVLFGFPLYFMQADGVYPALRNILTDLNSALPVADGDAPPIGLNLWCYPNPFCEYICFEIEKGAGERVDIGIYNTESTL